MRTRANPYGDGSDPATVEANLLAKQMIQIILELVPGGATIIIESPMGLHFWELDVVLLHSGMDGFHVIRSDHCMSGAPCQKPQLWLTTSPGLVPLCAFTLDRIQNGWPAEGRGDPPHTRENS